MKKQSQRRLRLHRESYRRLDSNALRRAVGGTSGQYGPACRSMPPNCNTTAAGKTCDSENCSVQCTVSGGTGSLEATCAFD